MALAGPIQCNGRLESFRTIQTIQNVMREDDVEAILGPMDLTEGR